MRLHQGRLFRWDGVNAGQNSIRRAGPEIKKARKVEFFWLCAECARTMTVVFNAKVGVTIRHLAGAETKEGVTAARRDTPRAGRSSESAASRQTSAFRRAAG